MPTPNRTRVRQYFKSFLKKIPVSETIFTKAIALRYQRSLNTKGFYRVQPATNGLPEFGLYTDVRGLGQLSKVRGRYEPHVQRLLVEECSAESTFWEVGAGWGFFSLALAPLVSNVVSFEGVPGRVANIRQSVQQNGYKNIQIVDGIVGDNISLAEFSPADVALMDVDGAETRIVQEEYEGVTAVPLWIIELHEPGLRNVLDIADPEVVIETMKEYGYKIRTLGYKKVGNYHIVARRT